jgi:uncharacterized membrane protein
MEAYASATGDRIMHHIGVAEVLVQLIESSRASRAEAVEQFREAMVGYVNESIDVIKADDIADKEELAKAVRKIIADLHSDRHDILAGEAPRGSTTEAITAASASDRGGDGDRKSIEAKSAQAVKTLPAEGTFASGNSQATGTTGTTGSTGSTESTDNKDGRSGSVKHAA